MNVKSPKVRSILHIILLYLLFGGLWVLLSDRVLELLVPVPYRIAALDAYKGWAFVVVSGLLIYGIVRREFRARERVEKSLRESEEKYRTLMQSANDGIVIADAETGIILDINKKIEELIGVPAQEIIGKHHTILYPKEEADRYQVIFEDAVRSGRAIVGEITVCCETGRTAPVEISANTIELGGRRIIQGIFRDMSEHEHAAEALQKERNRAQRYLDVAGVMLVVLNAEGKVTLINKKGRTILGYEEREILGENWFDHFVPGGIRAEVKAVFKKLMAGEVDPVEYFENPVVTKNHEERMIAWHNAVLKDEAGNIIGTLSSGEDITARKRAEEQARYRLQHLETMHAIDMIISSTLDLRVTLEEILTLVTSQLHVDAAGVLLLDPHTQILEYAATHGFHTPGIQHSRVRLGEGIAGLAALERRSISIPNLLDTESGFVRTPLLEGEGFVGCSVVPLIAKGQVKGVLEVLHRSSISVNVEWQEFLEALAAQAAIAIDNATLFNDLQRSNAELILAYDTTIEGWSHALELRDKETEGHTARAVEMTLRIAHAMNINEEQLVQVRRGALLHDIGKMTIPDSILFKTGPLTEEEWKTMRHHPAYAFELLSPIAYLRSALDIPYCHHEKWDGSGYPRGLKGEQIPLAARIFSLADTWDALYSERRYHPAWSKEKVREHIRSLAGTDFDPKVVEVFLEIERSSEAKSE